MVGARFSSSLVMVSGVSMMVFRWDETFMSAGADTANSTVDNNLGLPPWTKGMVALDLCQSNGTPYCCQA